MPAGDLPIVLALAAAAVMLVLGLALAFGTLDVTVVLVAAGAYLIAGIAWGVGSGDLLVVLFQSAIAAASVAVIAATAVGRMPRRTLIVYLIAWLLLVLLPIGLSVLDVTGGWLSVEVGLLDFGGATQLGLAAGAAVAALGLVGARTSNWWHVVIGALLVVGGLVLLVVGGEFAIDRLSPLVSRNVAISAAGGLLAWAIGELIATRRLTVTGVAAGGIAGALAAAAGAPWLAIEWALVLGVITGLVASVVARALSRTRVGSGATFAAVGVVAGVVGLLHPGVVAIISGFVWSGRLDLWFGQLTGIGIVLGYSVAMAIGIAGVARRASMVAPATAAGIVTTAPRGIRKSR
jgi:Amt family ammonium transporter